MVVTAIADREFVWWDDLSTETRPLGPGPMGGLPSGNAPPDDRYPSEPLRSIERMFVTAATKHRAALGWLRDASFATLSDTRAGIVAPGGRGVGL